MRRIVFTLVACLVALGSASRAGATPTDPARMSITCDDAGGPTARLYQLLLGRPADLGGLGYWVDRLPVVGRQGVATWITLGREPAPRRPLAHSTICAKVWNRGFTEVQPGIAVGRWESTVIVVADRSLVDFRAVDGRRTRADRIAGDIVVNANWFTAAGSLGPVVSDGIRSGSDDIIERGQIVAYRAGCGGHRAGELEHIWTGHLYTPGPCVENAVSGVSLVHHGLRADAYPGITLGGYTGNNRAHSFIGYADDQIVIVATTQMTASKLADFAIALGVGEGIMLDGGGSTQIATPTERIVSQRPVTSFAVLDARFGADG